MKSTTSRPSILGIWRLGERLHESNATEVALAQPADATGSPRWDYVIKRATSREDVESCRQIARFAAAAAAAAHPNLVAVLDASVTSASPYVVMPRLDGKDMKWHLEQPERKLLPVALWLVRQVAQGLAALHASGWVHGDVKPANVMVGSRGHVTLVDLGFATRVHTVADSHYRGTPDYSAPETLHENIAAMPPRDVYSLGRVMGDLLNVVQTVSGAMLEPVTELVNHMTAPDPSRRPSAEEVTRHLLQLEIETLGRHIGPHAPPSRRAA